MSALHQRMNHVAEHREGLTHVGLAIVAQTKTGGWSSGYCQQCHESLWRSVAHVSVGCDYLVRSTLVVWRRAFTFINQTILLSCRRRSDASQMSDYRTASTKMSGAWDNYMFVHASCVSFSSQFMSCVRYEKRAMVTWSSMLIDSFILQQCDETRGKERESCGARTSSPSTDRNALFRAEDITQQNCWLEDKEERKRGICCYYHFVGRDEDVLCVLVEIKHCLHRLMSPNWRWSTRKRTLRVIWETSTRRRWTSVAA